MVDTARSEDESHLAAPTSQGSGPSLYRNHRKMKDLILASQAEPESLPCVVKEIKIRGQQYVFDD